MRNETMRVTIYINHKDVRAFEKYMQDCPVDGEMHIEGADD